MFLATEKRWEVWICGFYKKYKIGTHNDLHCDEINRCYDQFHGESPLKGCFSIALTQ